MTQPAIESPPNFNSYPSIRAFFRGVPGVEYLYALTKNLVKYRRKGWEPTNPAATFTIGDVDFIVLARGKRIPGASIEATLPKLHLDSEADLLLPQLAPKENSNASEQPGEERRTTTHEAEAVRAIEDGDHDARASARKAPIR